MFLHVKVWSNDTAGIPKDLSAVEPNLRMLTQAGILRVSSPPGTYWIAVGALRYQLPVCRVCNANEASSRRHLLRIVRSWRCMF
jgi:hypothetical protein